MSQFQVYRLISKSTYQTRKVRRFIVLNLQNNYNYTKKKVSHRLLTPPNN